MLDQLIADYLAALRKRVAAREESERLTDRVKSAADAMAAAEKSVKPGGQVAMHGGFGVNRDVIDPAGWPTAADVNRAWTALLGSSALASDAWQRIPNDQRVGLVPPDAK
jgi:hypothetical protein